MAPAWSSSPRSSRKRRSESASKKSKKVKKTSGKKGGSGDESASYDSDLDLEKQLKPIGGYIHHREEMIEHMFKCIKGVKLRGMLPEILKNLSMDELKRRCLEQLEIMSKKRIRRILEGADPEAISSSGTEDDSSDDERRYADKGPTVTKSQAADSTQPEADTSVSQSEDWHVPGGVEPGPSAESRPVPEEQEELQSDRSDESDEDGELHDDQSDVEPEQGTSEEAIAEHQVAPQDAAGSKSQDDGTKMAVPLEHLSEDVVIEEYEDEFEIGPDAESGDDVEPGEAQDEDADVDDDGITVTTQASEEYYGEMHTASGGEIHKEHSDLTRKLRGAEEPRASTSTAAPPAVSPKQPIGSGDTGAGKGGLVISQNQMEILELEMRARAIKAMLKATELKEKGLKQKLATAGEPGQAPGSAVQAAKPATFTSSTGTFQQRSQPPHLNRPAVIVTQSLAGGMQDKPTGSPNPPVSSGDAIRETLRKAALINRKNCSTGTRVVQPASAGQSASTSSAVFRSVLPANSGVSAGVAAKPPQRLVLQSQSKAPSVDSSSDQRSVSIQPATTSQKRILRRPGQSISQHQQLLQQTPARSVVPHSQEGRQVVWVHSSETQPSSTVTHADLQVGHGQPVVTKRRIIRR